MKKLQYTTSMYQFQPVDHLLQGFGSYETKYDFRL